jgi:T5SS/PEP-CTERM-associated repeat protein
LFKKPTRIHHHAAGNAVVCLYLIAVVCLCLLCLVQPAYSAVTWFGDVDPNDPTTWNASTYGYIGKTGSGTMDITGGGAVSNSTVRIGYGSGSTGAVTVDGTGSTWNSSRLFVSDWGYGTLNITDGGAVNSSSGHIGNSSGSTGAVTVDGTGSTWTNSSDPYVGRYGSGTMDITDGGAVSNRTGYIGYLSGSTGAVTVDGTGSTWTNSGSLIVGNNGSGTMDITGGGAVSNLVGHIGTGSGSTGAVTVDGTGSTWTNSANFLVGLYGSGTLNITDGGAVSVAGILIIDSNADDASFINMSTGGMLALLGDADANGDDDILLAEFMGLISGTDAIRYWDGSGWADITGATYGDDYTLDYLTSGDLLGYTMLTVGVFPIPGDCNGDGIVTTADLEAVTGHWQQYVTGGAAEGDLNGDGQVTTADLAAVTGNWQYGVTTIPEPTTVVMLIAGLIGVLVVRRRGA